VRIGFVSSEYVTEPGSSGGLANYLGRAAPALIERGHEVEVFVAAKVDGQIEHAGVLVHRVAPVSPRRPSRRSRLLRRLLRRGATSLLPCELEALALARAVRTRAAAGPRSFDVVQAANYQAVGLHLSSPRDFALVVRCSFHRQLWDGANQIPETAPRRRLHNLELACIEQADGAFAPSHWLAEEFRQREGVHLKVIETPFYCEIPSGEPSQLAQQFQDHPFLLFCGTLGRFKGLHLLRDALPGLLRNHEQLRVLLAGKTAGSPGAELLQGLLERCGQHRARVHYLGVLEHKDLYPLMRQAAVITLPSLVDNLPNACLEALGMGGIVVASAGASFDQVIQDRRSGFLFQLGSAKALEETVERALSLPSEEASLVRAAARESVSRLDPRRTLDCLERYYEDVCAERGRAARPRASGRESSA
jgi:glycogen(starch) synthase